MATWIRAHHSGARWHIGVLTARQYGGPVWRTACKGQQIGGAWGPSREETDTAPSELEYLHCKRCAAIAAKAA